MILSTYVCQPRYLQWVLGLIRFMPCLWHCSLAFARPSYVWHCLSVGAPSQRRVKQDTRSAYGLVDRVARVLYGVVHRSSLL